MVCGAGEPILTRAGQPVIKNKKTTDMKSMNQFAVLALAAAGLLAGASRVRAQSATISSAVPDLLMGFEVADDSTGTGANSNLELDLGYTATSLVAAAISNGGTLVLGGTNFQTDLSADDIGTTYGANWYTRTSGGGELNWSIFGSNTTTNEFWTTNTSTFNRESSSNQQPVAFSMSNVYGDLSGQTSTANSNEDYVDGNASGTGSSYFNAISDNDTSSGWGGYNFGSGGPEVTVGTTTPIPFYDSVATNSNGLKAQEIGTFSLSNGGVLTFTVVPEPSTWASIVLGGAGLLLFRRRRLA